MTRPALFGLLLAASLTACGPSGYPPALAQDSSGFEPPVKRLVDERVAAVEAAPADARAHARLGAAYQANGLWLPAAESFAQAAALGEEEPLWPYYGARALMLMSRSAEARAEAERALERDAGFAPAHLLLGWLQLEDGDVSGARQSFERSRDLEPRRPEPLVGLATLALDSGDPALARELATRALELQQGFRQARFVLGSALVALGEVERGRAEMEAGADAILSNMPTSFSGEIVSAQVNRADVLARASQLSVEGRSDLALELLDQLARDFPNDAVVHNNRGQTLDRLGRTDEAIAALEASTRLDGRLSRTWGNLARLYVRAGRVPAAVEAGERAVALDDTNHEAWSILAVAKRRESDLPGAMQAARRALDLQPENAAYHSALGNVFAAAQQYEAAVTAFRRSAELDPSDAEYEFALASVLMGLSRFDEARASLDRARAVAPNSPALRQLDAKLAERAGR
ncbi:MAG: tetratricopeptide repeat protein [Planctomycetes bacterium]|nr:tetratricopeptide repeat protein [Planctomycetota bacterium]MCB9905001.1 tetratricopeptide repeat protein [Planctomycetota bacterium]